MKGAGSVLRSWKSAQEEGNGRQYIIIIIPYAENLPWILGGYRTGCNMMTNLEEKLDRANFMLKCRDDLRFSI